MEHRIGAQTITWGDLNKNDMPGILDFLKDNGFEGVETGMRHFEPSKAVDYRNLYKKTGIIPLGLHSGGQFWDPDAAESERRKLRDAVNFAQKVGFRWVVVSGNKDETPDSMKEAAGFYNEIGSLCREAGLGFAYHNHNWELVDNSEILEVLVESTETDLVSLVLDVAWAHIGGFDLAELLKRFGNRVGYIHLKDVKGDRFCELGRGDMDLESVLNLADTHRIEWIVIEQDYTDLTPEESMTINRRYLAGQGW